jgi:hypothetical protein
MAVRGIAITLCVLNGLNNEGKDKALFRAVGQAIRWYPCEALNVQATYQASIVAWIYNLYLTICQRKEPLGKERPVALGLLRLPALLYYNFGARHQPLSSNLVAP